ncbi:hypothetical protein [Niveispirillum irakense]|uniref:hypothetical protein n=1 Tax=Niveispirillum irakense TaxID=34011 RepID=UPI0012B57196|nr:hypothetical protein [Niveispirillum irakense]
MIKIHVKIGVICGLTSIPLLIVFVLDLIVGNCFFEEGCGEYENFMLFLVFIGTCLLAACVGWLASRLARFALEIYNKS